MTGVNKVILIGNLGSDPEVRYTPSGKAVANFRIATTEQWTNKEGSKEERTEWHRIVAWGRLGEICGQYLRKGKQVYIEGRLQTRSWDDAEGQKRYMTEVVAQTMQMLGRAGEDAAGDQPRRQAQAGGGPDADYPQPPPSGTNEDDDLPF